MLQQLPRVRDPDEGDFGPADVIRWLYRHKIAIFLCTFVFAAATAAYSLTIPRSYHAIAILRLVTPPETQSPMSAAMGGLGGLAGSFLGMNINADDTAVTLAYLQSRAFVRAFIEEKGLLPELYPDRWGAVQKQWIGEPPQIDRATNSFANRLRVEQDNEGIVTLEVTWSSAQRAGEIATQLIARVNDVRREQALERAKGNFDYLTERLRREPVQEMRTTIANMASRELTLLMVAQGPSDYALEQIGPIFAPEIPVAPRRTIMTMIGAIVGFSLCVIVLLLRQALSKP